MFYKKNLLKFILVLIISISFLSIKLQVNANELTTYTDKLSAINTNIVSSHTITFGIVNPINAGGNIQITFPSSSFIFGSAYSFSDISLAQGSSSNCSSATFIVKTLAATASGTTWGATYSSNQITLTSATDTLTANTCIQVILNTNGLNHTITNPNITSNTTYNITINTSSQDTGEAAVVILGYSSLANNDQIQVNAQISSTSISLIVDASLSNCSSAPSNNNLINLGVLPISNNVVSGGNIQFICLGGGTNAPNGMKILLQSSNNSINGALVSGSNSLNATTANLNIASKGYGVRVVNTGTTQVGSFNILAPFNSTLIGSVGAMSGLLSNPSQIINSTSPVNSTTNNRIQIEVGAKIDTTQSAGTYTDLLTFTAYTL